MRMRPLWIFSTLVFGALVGSTLSLPVKAQFIQFPQQGLQSSPFDRPQQPLVQPNSGFQPFPSQVISTETCNSGQNSVTTFVGIPQDSSRPPRIQQFVIPTGTCLRVDSNGNTQAVVNQQLGNRSIFSFCQNVSIRSHRGFFNARYVLECQRTDGQVDRLRIRGQSPEGFLFDQLRRGDDGRDGGDRQLR
jgi:hypothetical protein